VMPKRSMPIPASVAITPLLYSACGVLLHIEHKTYQACTP
jgi:hypothetical protein